MKKLPQHERLKAMASLLRAAFPFWLVTVILAIGTWMAHNGITAHDFFQLADDAVQALGRR